MISDAELHELEVLFIEKFELHDFGNLFFDEWDFDQWNLLWNMLASCIQIFCKKEFNFSVFFHLLTKC